MCLNSSNPFGGSGWLKQKHAEEFALMVRTTAIQAMKAGAIFLRDCQTFFIRFFTSYILFNLTISQNFQDFSKHEKVGSKHVKVVKIDFFQIKS